MLANSNSTVLDILMDAKSIKLVESLTGGEINHTAQNDEEVRYFHLRCDKGLLEAVGLLASAGLMARAGRLPERGKPMLQFRGYATVPPTRPGASAPFDESRLLFEDLSAERN